MIDFT